ncbi:MAG TPA: PH domain-containing protein [Flavitalea sp.]|nr:PH domain-containing protein [Flavitalea sp.]
MKSESWEIPQRQSAAGLLIFIIRSVITVLKAAWPFLAVILFRGKSKSGNEFLFLLIAVSLFVLVRSILGYYFFRFFISGTDLIINKGMIRKKTITIPLEKIQSVNSEQTLLHQIFQIVRLRIDTAGSDKTEATIDAIEIKKAAAFRSYLLKESEVGQHGTSGETPSYLIRLSVTDLLRLGISSNHFQTFFIVLAFAISFVQNLEEIFGQKVISYLQENSAYLSLQATLLLAIAVLLVSIFVSVFRTWFRFFDFQLTEDSHGFRLRSGLLNTKQQLVPPRKIQFFSWKANWLRRQINLYTLDFHQASKDAVSRKQRITVPITSPAMIDTLLNSYHKDIRQSADSMHSIHAAYAWRRTLLPGVPVVVLLGLILIPLLSWSVIWLLLFLPVQYISAWFYRKHFRIYIAENALEIVSGVWGRKIKLMRWEKLQLCELRQSIFQRRKGLATVLLRTAGGTMKIPFIPLSLSHMLCNYALYKTERSNESWM